MCLCARPLTVSRRSKCAGCVPILDMLDIARLVLPVARQDFAITHANVRDSGRAPYCRRPGQELSVSGC